MLTHEQQVKRDLENNEKWFNRLLNDLLFDPYEELWKIIDKNKL